MNVIRTSRDAEEVARDWLRNHGYPRAECTAIGADGGLDVWAPGLVVQVKAEAKPAGRPVVQQIAGIASHQRAKAACFALAGFTRQAFTWAEAANVALFKFDREGDIVAANPHASALTVSASAGLKVRWQGELWTARGLSPSNVMKLSEIYGGARILRALFGTAVLGRMVKDDFQGSLVGSGCLLQTTERVVLWSSSDSSDCWSESRSISQGLDSVTLTVGEGVKGHWLAITRREASETFAILGSPKEDIIAFAETVEANAKAIGGRTRYSEPGSWRHPTRWGKRW